MDKIERDLSKKGRLSANQYGFRAGRSTIDAISRTYEIAVDKRMAALQHRRLTACGFFMKSLCDTTK